MYQSRTVKLLYFICGVLLFTLQSNRAVSFDRGRSPVLMSFINRCRLAEKTDSCCDTLFYRHGRFELPGCNYYYLTSMIDDEFIPKVAFSADLDYSKIIVLNKNNDTLFTLDTAFWCSGIYNVQEALIVAQRRIGGGMKFVIYNNDKLQEFSTPAVKYKYIGRSYNAVYYQNTQNDSQILSVNQNGISEVCQFADVLLQKDSLSMRIDSTSMLKDSIIKPKLVYYDGNCFVFIKTVFLNKQIKKTVFDIYSLSGNKVTHLTTFDNYIGRDFEAYQFYFYDGKTYVISQSIRLHKTQIHEISSDSVKLLFDSYDYPEFFNKESKPAGVAPELEVYKNTLLFTSWDSIVRYGARAIFSYSITTKKLHHIETKEIPE